MNFLIEWLGNKSNKKQLLKGCKGVKSQKLNLAYFYVHITHYYKLYIKQYLDLQVKHEIFIYRIYINLMCIHKNKINV